MKRGFKMHAVEVAEEGQLLALAIAFYDEVAFACDPDAMCANLRVLRSSPQAHVAVVTDVARAGVRDHHHILRAGERALGAFDRQP